MKTIRVRRSHPSALSLALALMITMFAVYVASLPAVSRERADTASAAAQSSAEVRMEGLEMSFICAGRCEDQLQARIQAALCAQNGGAGLILADGRQYAVISAAKARPEADEDAISRQANGLTLKISGPAGQIAAISDASSFLRAQATETGGLAGALERGETNAASICALLNVYRTQGQQSLDSLKKIENPNGVVQRFIAAAQAALDRIDCALAQADPGKIKLIHAAACGEWISMLEDFRAEKI